jgi:hypothetical protein
MFEIFYLARYLFLNAISKGTGLKVTYLPRWAVDSKVAFLQPTMWDLSSADVIVDDSRARKVLG